MGALSVILVRQALLECFEIDSIGQWIIGFSGYCGFTTNLHAELLAILHGLQIAWSRGLKKINYLSLMLCWLWILFLMITSDFILITLSSTKFVSSVTLIGRLSSSTLIEKAIKLQIALRKMELQSINICSFGLLALINVVCLSDVMGIVEFR